jgi:hypothetical protein
MPSATPHERTNFYTVLLHEIEYTLGTEHSAHNNYSIRYAYRKAIFLIISKYRVSQNSRIPNSERRKGSLQ